MTAAQNLSTSIDQLIARIDSQDESFVLPIRQFLEDFGYVVTTGNRHKKIPHYHIIAGDTFFVKKIISEGLNDGIKRLVLVWNEIGEEWKNFFDALPAKIVSLPPKQLSPRELQMVFAFFFSGESKMLNLFPPPKAGQAPLKSTERLLQKEHRTPSTTISHHQREEDRKRISLTMDEIFLGKTPEEKNIKTEKRIKKNSTQKKFLHRFIFLMGVFLLPLAWYTTSLAISIGTLAISSKFLLEGKTTSAIQINRLSKYWITQGKGALLVVGIPFQGIGLKQIIRQQERFWSLLTDVTQGEEGVEAITTRGQIILHTLFATDQNQQTATTESVASALEGIRNDLFLIQNHLGAAQGQLTSLIQEKSFPFFLPITLKIGEKGNNALAKLRSDTIAIDNLLSLYQKIAGFKEKKTYLILLQNSMELRPTGGFIGSIILATFNEGKLVDLQIQDVYTVDGQLKGHVDPPLPIAELLGQEHWYLRDSNWDPDFSISGQKASWFYQKETGTVVDGTIAINVPLIQSLLTATGPIVLSDYNDRITAENFFGKSLFYTKNDFFPGSTQKKDFLGTLTTSLIAKLTTGKNIRAPLVFRAVANGLTRQDILFSFVDPQLETLVSRLGWGGSVPAKQTCEKEAQSSCLFDYFYLVDANLGVNKVNYFIERQLVRAITIHEDGKIQETVNLSYKNTSQGDNEGGGVYRNFARFYVPADSILASITIDGDVVRGRPIAKPPTPPSPPYTTTEGTVGDLSVVGLAFDVPPGAERRVVISYQRRTPFIPDNQGSVLEIYHQKQPGLSHDSLQTVVTYPIFWTNREGILTASKQAASEVVKQAFLAKEAQLLYNTTLSQDSDIRIRFIK